MEVDILLSILGGILTMGTGGISVWAWSLSGRVSALEKNQGEHSIKLDNNTDADKEFRSTIKEEFDKLWKSMQALNEGINKLAQQVAILNEKMK